MGTLAENLREKREAMGLSQARLAKEAGVAQQLISQIESGKNTTTKKLPQIARVLGCTVADLDPNFTPDASTPAEEDILAAYRAVPAGRKALGLRLLHDLALESEGTE